MRGWSSLFVLLMTPIVGALSAAFIVFLLFAGVLASVGASGEELFPEDIGGIAALSTSFSALLAACPGAIGGLLVGGLLAMAGEKLGNRANEEYGSSVGAVSAGCLGAVIGGIGALLLCCGTIAAISALASPDLYQ